MKKIISLCMVALIIGSMSMTAFATTTENSKLDNRIETLNEKQARIEELKIANEEKLIKFEEFKQSLTEKQQEILNNTNENIAIAANTNQLRIDLLQSLDEIKKNGTELPEETIFQLEEYNSQVLELVKLLEDTKGQIKSVVVENKEFIKARDYESMDAAYDEILTLQVNRNDLLEDINELLQEMNALL
ncbi:MAG: hypothetical protein WBJ13_13630 [Sedimentibacter sp.]